MFGVVVPLVLAAPWPAAGGAWPSPPVWLPTLALLLLGALLTEVVNQGQQFKDL